MRRIHKLLTMSGGGAAWQDQLLAAFPGGDDVWSLFSTPNNCVYMYQHIGGDKYYRIKINDSAAGANASVIQDAKICTIYKSMTDLTTPAVTLNGTWTKASGTSYLGGRLFYTNSGGGGRYAELTFVGTTVGASIQASQVGTGLALVTIDGNNTLADLLPTAQQLVDSGAIANTCLVANGGTLNPTDRIYDTYNLPTNIAAADYGSAGRYDLFTASLSNGSHTIRLTSTGYAHIGATNTLLMLDGILYSGPNARAADNGYSFMLITQNLGSGAEEISYNFLPAGATYRLWLGHAGQAKVTVAPAITVDGAAFAKTDVNYVAGSEIVFSQTSSIRHAEIGGGATNLGTYVITYTLNKSTGLTISHTVTWATDGDVYGYPCMMAVDHAVFDRFKTHNQAEKDLLALDNSVNLNTQTAAAWCWDLDGNAARLLYIPDLALTVDNWAYADGVYLYWQDISDPTWKKAYTVRYKVGMPYVAFTNGQAVSSVCNYRAAWFTGGANAALAGKF